MSADGDTGDGDGDGETQSTQTRWWLTNDLLAAWLLVSFVGLIAAGGLSILDLSAVPKLLIQSFATFAGVSVAWAFGTDALQAWRGK